MRLMLILSASFTASALLFYLCRPPRRLGPRLAPYTVAARAAMGDAGAELEALLPPAPTGVASRMFGPILRAAIDKVNGWLGQRDEEATALALEHAGITDVTPSQFRDQQFLWAAYGVGLGVVAGAVSGARTGLLCIVTFGVYGAFRKRIELTRRTNVRRRRMRAELWQLGPQLAVKAQATMNVQAVIRRMCAEARDDCEVANEMRRILQVMDAGTPGELAFRAAAVRTAEPFASRLYRTLADAIEKGGPLAQQLLDQADDVRHAYQSERVRSATGRTVAMIIPTTLMAAMLLLLIGAPALHLLFNPN